MTTAELPVKQQWLLLFAFRYALGRESTAPSIVAEALLANMPKFNDTHLRLFVEEIDEAIRLTACGRCCDKSEWLKVRAAAEKELEKRK